MIFNPTAIKGVVIVDLEPLIDDRGFFARAFCAREFEAAGLRPCIAQTNLAYNPFAGTLRGLHYQRPPAGEAKLIRCVRGRIFDVAVDLREGSPTYLRHVGVVLDTNERRALYVPEGCAHGYLTLDANSEVMYQVSEYYTPAAEGGLRWNDPKLAIDWPEPARLISPKDASWSLLTETAEVRL